MTDIQVENIRSDTARTLATELLNEAHHRHGDWETTRWAVNHLLKRAEEADRQAEMAASAKSQGPVF